MPDGRPERSRSGGAAAEPMEACDTPLPLVPIEAADAPLFERVDPILAAHGFFAAAYEQREQMFLLRLPAPAINRLLAPALRDQLVAELAPLGLHYIALDMDPLRI